MSVILSTMRSTRQDGMLAREAKKQALKDIKAELEREKKTRDSQSQDRRADNHEVS